MKRTLSIFFLVILTSAALADDYTLKPQFPLPDSSHSVGIMHMSGPDWITKDNPSGFYTDIPGIPGSNEWQDAYIAKALPVLKKIKAGTVQFWDEEGWSLRLPNGEYVGQPEIAQQLNPNFDYKRFFKRWRDLHYEVGVCVRANQRIVDGKPVLVPWQEQYQRVRTSIAFASKEWKVRWVYIDSNYREALPDGIANAWADGPLTPDTMWPRLHKEFKVRLVPEHKGATTHLWTIPYRELRLGESGTPSYVLRDIPQAISFINCSGVTVEQLRAAMPSLREAVKRGCVLGIDAWWPNDVNAAFADVWN